MTTTPDATGPDLSRLMLDPERYRSLHEPHPVRRGRYFNGAPIWLVSRYDDVRAVVAHPAVAHDPAAAVEASARVSAGQPAAFRPYARLAIGSLDGPAHARVHGLLTKAFSPRRVQGLRPHVERLVDELLDGVAGRECVDLLEEFAHPLPVRVICELIGVPPRDRDRWAGWTRELTWATPDRLATAADAVVADARRLVALRRAEPGDDLLSELATAGGADRLTDDELVSLVITFLHTGHETTVQLIGNGVYALLSHPDQLALLRSRPDLLPRAVDELLRFHSPMDIGVPRFTTAPVAVGDTVIPAGEVVQVVYAAANRDPERFPEPDRLDLARDGEPHLAFGWGPHHCLGAALAKAQGEIAIGRLVDRFPGLAPAVPLEEVRWRIGFARGLDRLPVRTA
ncbi:Cytochrome P450 107B1 [Actinosynnema sp. ALI-1.44]